MNEFQQIPAQPEEPDRQPIDALSLKELFVMSDDEEIADVESILTVVEEALQEPIPDLSDPIAVDEFNAKMRAIRDWASTQEDRIDQLIIQRAESRIIETA